jgi:hypothetical protein
VGGLQELLDVIAARPKAVVTNTRPPTGDLREVIQTASAGNPKAWADIKRICAVPIHRGYSPEQLEDVQARWVLAGATLGGKPFVLRPQQATAIRAWEDHQGLFVKIGVGKGKTIVTLAIAQSAYETALAKKIMLNVPANVYTQLVSRDIPAARKLIRFTVPVHRMGGGLTPQKRIALAKSGKTGLYIYPYSVMSAPSAYEEMAEINPALILSDEAQNVAAGNNARGRRYIKICRERKPIVVVLSGTLTKKSITEYHHRADLSLRERSFLPHSPSLIADWSAGIDSDGAVTKSTASGPLRPLVDWAVREFPDEAIPLDLSGFRKAFRLRQEPELFHRIH